MEATQIEAHLSELGNELERQGIERPIRLLVIGGAFMLLEVRNRKSTRDIDILFIDVENPSAASFYPAFRAAVRAVAARKRLRESWLNDLVAEVLSDISLVPEGMLWRQFGKLEVYLPPKDYILALKLLAGRRKDTGDILALCRELQIQTQEQAQALVDQYIPDPQVQHLNHLERTLKRAFGA